MSAVYTGHTLACLLVGQCLTEHTDKGSQGTKSLVWFVKIPHTGDKASLDRCG